MWRTWTSIAGIVLILIGIPMLVCPGPGLLVLTSGVALLLGGRLPRRSEIAEWQEWAEQGARVERSVQPIDASYSIRESERAADTMARQSAAETNGDLDDTGD